MNKSPVQLKHAQSRPYSLARYWRRRYEEARGEADGAVIFLAMVTLFIGFAMHG